MKPSCDGWQRFRTTSSLRRCLQRCTSAATNVVVMPGRGVGAHVLSRAVSRSCLSPHLGAAPLVSSPSRCSIGSFCMSQASRVNLCRRISLVMSSASCELRLAADPRHTSLPGPFIAARARRADSRHRRRQLRDVGPRRVLLRQPQPRRGYGGPTADGLGGGDDP